MTTGALLDSPAVKLALQTLSAYTALALLHRLAPLDLLLVLASGALAATIWVLEYEREIVARATSTSMGKVWFDFAARVSGQTPAPTTAEPAAVSVLLTDSDFGRATHALRQRIRGHDQTITKTIEHVRRGIRLRQTAAPMGDAPLATFVLVGGSGTGKRLLATTVGGALLGDQYVATLDATHGAACSPALMAAARSHSRLCLVVDNADRSSPDLLHHLRSILSGEPLVDATTGSSRSARDWIIFLLIHKDAKALTEAPASTTAAGAHGGTVFASQLGHLGLDQHLVWQAHECFPIVMPDPSVQAEIVLLEIQKECERHGLSLRQVAPEILAHEVNEIEKAGSFEQMPARIVSRLRRPLFAAVSRGETALNLELSS